MFYYFLGNLIMCFNLDKQTFQQNKKIQGDLLASIKVNTNFSSDSIHPDRDVGLCFGRTC